MDAVLQNFRKSFLPSTLFFHSLSLDPPATMEELYRRVDRYSTLEDICAVTQTIVIISKLARSSKSERKKLPEPEEGHGKNRK